MRGARVYFLPSRDVDIWMPASFSPEHVTLFWWHDEQIVARRARPGPWRPLLLTLVGLTIGLVLSAAAARVTSALFYGFGRPMCRP